MLEAANMLRSELDTSNSLLPGVVSINKKNMLSIYYGMMCQMISNISL